MVPEGSMKYASSCQPTPEVSQVCGMIKKKHPSGYRQLPKDTNRRIQYYIPVQETNDTKATHTTHCSEVTPKQ